MIGKNQKKNPIIALKFLYAKKKKYVMPMFQNIIEIIKTSYSFNDSKRRKIALYCSKEITCIFKSNNIKNIVVSFIV